MPIYIDRHAQSAIPRGVLTQMIHDDRQGLVDSRGVHAVGHWAGQRVIYCVLEAPGLQAVRNYHGDRNLKCGDIHQTLDGAWSGSELEELGAHIRGSIEQIWP